MAGTSSARANERLGRCAAHLRARALAPTAAASGQKTKVLLVGTMHPSGPEMLAQREDIELIHIEKAADGSLLSSEQRVAEMQAQVADADLLVMRVTPLQADTIAMAKKLLAVSWHGVGFDPVDVAALRARGIPLLLPGSANSTAVAEQTMMHMLSVARKTKEYDAQARLGNHSIRDNNSLISLEGKTVLIVGFGRVGTRVAKRCTAFEMNIVVSDPAIPRRAVEGLGYEYCFDFRERLHDADVVTLHIPAQEDGSAVIAAKEFALMKKGCILVNCARGTLLDEGDLVSALSTGQLAGAGLDVLRQEPYDPDHPLFALPPTIPVHVSPHSSPSTVET